MATLLSVFALFLSVTANCADCCPSDDICATEQHESCPNPCSPFSLCNTCVGFIVVSFDCFHVKPQEFSRKINLFALNIYASPFIKGIWQPPQSV